MKYRLLRKRIAAIGRKIGKGVTTCVNRILDYEKDERMPAAAVPEKSTPLVVEVTKGQSPTTDAIHRFVMSMLSNFTLIFFKKPKNIFNLYRIIIQIILQFSILQFIIRTIFKICILQIPYKILLKQFFLLNKRNFHYYYCKKTFVYIFKII